jgi:predicted esterase
MQRVPLVTSEYEGPGLLRYDIVGLDDRASESCDGIEESVERVRQLLAHEHSLGTYDYKLDRCIRNLRTLLCYAAGLPYSRMLLAGFSQGGAMSLFTGLQLPKLEGRDSEHALAGLVVMSGYLPGTSAACCQLYSVLSGLLCLQARRSSPSRRA